MGFELIFHELLASQFFGDVSAKMHTFSFCQFLSRDPWTPFCCKFSIKNHTFEFLSSVFFKKSNSDPGAPGNAANPPAPLFKTLQRLTTHHPEPQSPPGPPPEPQGAPD